MYTCIHVCWRCKFAAALSKSPSQVLLGKASYSPSKSQLALGGWQDLTDGLGRTSRAGNNIARGRTATTPVLCRHTIHGLLSGGIGVDSGHQALLDANALLQQHVANWCQAVRSAGGVGHHIHGGLVVLGVVHAADQSLQIAFARSGDDDLLGPGFNVTLSLVCLHEQASGFDHIFNSHVLQPGFDYSTLFSWELSDNRYPDIHIVFFDIKSDVMCGNLVISMLTFAVWHQLWPISWHVFHTNTESNICCSKIHAAEIPASTLTCALTNSMWHMFRKTKA